MGAAVAKLMEHPEKQEVVDSVFKKFDKNKNGELDYFEFRSFVDALDEYFAKTHIDLGGSNKEKKRLLDLLFVIACPLGKDTINLEDFKKVPWATLAEELASIDARRKGLLVEAIQKGNLKVEGTWKFEGYSNAKKTQKPFILTLTGGENGTYMEPRYYLDGDQRWAKDYKPPVDLCKAEIIEDQIKLQYSGAAESGKYEISMYGTGSSRWTLTLSFDRWHPDREKLTEYKACARMSQYFCLNGGGQDRDGLVCDDVKLVAFE